jgi:hypothetical protein
MNNPQKLLPLAIASLLLAIAKPAMAASIAGIDLTGIKTPDLVFLGITFLGIFLCGLEIVLYQIGLDRKNSKLMLAGCVLAVVGMIGQYFSMYLYL